jgi:hypothetical protein
MLAIENKKPIILMRNTLLLFPLMLAAAFLPAQGDQFIEAAISTGDPVEKNTSRRKKPPLPPSPQPQVTGKSIQRQYATVELWVKENDGTAPAEHFYVDVFKAQPGGQRKLVRTKRQIGSFSELHLERGFDHYIKVEIWEHTPLELTVTAAQLDEAEGRPLKQEAVLIKIPIPEKPEEPASSAAPLEQSSLGTALNEMPPPALQQEMPIEPTPPTSQFSRSQKLFRLSKEASLYHSIGGSGKVIAKINAGAPVEILERTTQEWWLASHKGKVGWLAVSCLE